MNSINSRDIHKRILGASTLAILVFSSSVTSTAHDNPTYIIIDQRVLSESRSIWLNNNEVPSQALKVLVDRASYALTRGPYTVVAKTELPPSGDPHDYLSYALEYWPNPNAADGLPWVRREGQHNPESNVDADSLVRLSKDAEAVALAWVLTSDDRYSRHLALLLKTWFLDSRTKMNPNAKYGALVPGRQRANFPVAGLAHIFVRIINAVQIAAHSDHWHENDSRHLKAWMAEFLHWMENSEEGQRKAKKSNNHGTYFDMFAAVLALYVGEHSTARKHIAGFRQRFAEQFASDGSQPNEMDRINNLGYHRYNLIAAMLLARASDHFNDIDLWAYHPPQGAGIENALDFLAPYASGKDEWRRFPRKPVRQSSKDWLKLYLMAIQGYGDRWPDIFVLHGQASAFRKLDSYSLCQFAARSTDAKGGGEHSVHSMTVPSGRFFRIW